MACHLLPFLVKTTTSHRHQLLQSTNALPSSSRISLAVKRRVLLQRGIVHLTGSPLDLLPVSQLTDNAPQKLPVQRSIASPSLEVKPPRPPNSPSVASWQNPTLSLKLVVRPSKPPPLHQHALPK